MSVERLRFGVLLPTQAPSDEQGVSAAFIDSVVQIAAHADASGADAVFMLQHFGSNMPTMQPWPTLAWLAPQLSCRIGSCIGLLPTQNPLQLAEEVATLDHLAPGRVILGVGAGYRQAELNAFGGTMQSRGARMADGVRALRALWAGEPAPESRFWAVGGMTSGLLPRTPGGPPIWMGAQSRAAVERAGELADAWIAPGNSPHGQWLVRHLAIHESARLAHGRQPAEASPVLLEACISESADARAAALSELRAEYADYARYEALGWFRDRFDEMAPSFLFGDPERVAARVDELASAGFNYLVIRPKWSRLATADALETIDNLAAMVNSHNAGSG